MKAIATYGLSNFGGIEILDIQYGINDSVVYRYNFGEPEKERRAKINYTLGGRAYFRTASGRIYLDECIKTI